MSPPPYFEDFLEAASPFVGILYFLWKYGGFRFSVTFSRWQPQVYDNIINLTFPCVSGLNDLLIQAIDMSYQLDIYMILQIIYIYIYTVKNKVRMRFWLRVMVARLAPPHGSRILTEETPVNMQKHS